MGEKITRHPKSADVRRAKSLKEALRSGSPPVLRHSPPSPGPTQEQASHSWIKDSLEVQKAYLEQLVEGIPEAISIIESPYQITRINTEFTRMFGFTPEEAVGQRIDALIVPPERHAETRWIGETLQKGQKIRLETKRRRKDGTLVDVCISGAPVIVGGTQVGIYVLYRDISEQKRAEALSSALYRIAERTSSAEDLQQFYAAMDNIVGELMCARNFYIALYDPETQLLSFPYFVDEQDPTPAPKKLGRGLTEYVLRTGEPLLATPRVFDDLLRCGEVELIGAPSLDWVGIPLKIANNSFGVLVVQSYTDDVRFGEWYRDILMFVFQQLASAIDHKRNEQALRRSEARYRTPCARRPVPASAKNGSRGTARGRRSARFQQSSDGNQRLHRGSDRADRVRKSIAPESAGNPAGRGSSHYAHSPTARLQPQAIARTKGGGREHHRV